MMLAGAITLTGFPWVWSFGAVRRAYELAPESVLPADIRGAPAEVSEAYSFAIANQEILRYIPCYCGCGEEGHTSNASCYLKDSSKPGNLVFDRMSLNWEICINITRDVMRTRDEGKPLKEIRTYIELKYSRYGPPTPPPPVP
jgi:hypothetical protein